jgi:hypothetical protein
MASKAARQVFRGQGVAEPETFERRDADERLRDESVELDDQSAQKLDPALLVLVEEGPGARGAASTKDGWARVQVRLRALTAETRRVLEAAGLVVQSTDGASVTGLATPAVLRALAALAEVLRIDAAP